MRIAVAMSGGVDSSVAAALLAGQGHEVIGVSMQLYPSAGAGFGTCCTLDDLNDARRVAQAIGIPHYVLNFEQTFDDHVVSRFVREYTRGRTPIPCAQCNSDVKFTALLTRARGFDADRLATGHYARIEQDGEGRYRLRRGLDVSKDQSYFLFSLTQTQLARAAFPVGHLTKSEVRAHASRLGLRVADKPDSQEICFVPDGDYAALIERRAPAAVRAGTIVHTDGTTLGSHAGVHRFTVGQRRGLGLSTGVPLYVVGIDAEEGRVRVGSRAALERTTLDASGVTWVIGVAPEGWRRVAAQIRHRHQAAPASVRALEGGRAALVFDTPQPAITPGQAVVFYDGDEVIGGGWIDRSVE
jgi:tRNA-specific 2-thiouridylase